MSSFDESRVSRDDAGRFDFKAPGLPAASLQEPSGARWIGGEDLTRVVASMVSKQRHRVPEHTDIDDIVQNACLEIGKTYGFDHIPLAPVKQVVSTTISRAQGHVNLGSTDRRAMTAFTELRQDREAELKRQLTAHEEDELAAEIRSTWPDRRHRPSKNFLQRARLASTGRIWRDDGTVVEGVNPWAGAQADAHDPSTAVGGAQDALNDQASGRARRQAWDALAELREADGQGHVPRVLAPVHSSQAAAWARATIDEYPGGVMGAVDRWQQAGEDEGTIALFAPFGAIDEEGRDAICSMLASRPQIADGLWNAALASSTRR